MFKITHFLLVCSFLDEEEITCQLTYFGLLLQYGLPHFIAVVIQVIKDYDHPILSKCIRHMFQMFIVQGVGDIGHIDTSSVLGVIQDSMGTLGQIILELMKPAKGDVEGSDIPKSFSKQRFQPAVLGVFSY